MCAYVICKHTTVCLVDVCLYCNCKYAKVLPVVSVQAMRWHVPVWVLFVLLMRPAVVDRWQASNASLGICTMHHRDLRDRSWLVYVSNFPSHLFSFLSSPTGHRAEYMTTR